MVLKGVITMRKFFLQLILLLTISMPSMGKALTRFTDSPLLSGSKIVAGNWSENEFFVLSKEDYEKVKTMFKQTSQNQSKTNIKTIKQIKLASNTTCLKRAASFKKRTKPKPKKTIKKLNAEKVLKIKSVKK